MRRLSTLFIVLTLLLASVPVHAAPKEKAPAEQPYPGRPSPATEEKVAPPDPDYSPQSNVPFKGELHTDEASEPGVISPMHFSLTPHIHEVEAVTRYYDGFDPDKKLGGPMSCPVGGSIDCTLAFSRSMTWKNKVGFTIKFDTGVIEGATGVDVEWSQTETVQYSVRFSPGNIAEIWKNDWYHMQDLDLLTTWIFSDGTIMEEAGTGWTAEWYEERVDPRIRPM